jgi:serine/threonine-protein kinase RsbW
MMTRPAPAAVGYTGVFPGRADQVGRARREVARYLADCPVASDALIVLSELATNAVLHSRSKHDFFTVHAELADWHARLVVEDAGGTWEPPGPAETDGGRGLQIVAALADAWGIDGDASGRVVWARLTW